MNTDTQNPETETDFSSNSSTREAGPRAPSSTGPDPQTPSEPTESPETEQQDDTADAEAQDDTGDDETGDVSKLRREAKRHRLKLREVEAERDAAVTKLNSLSEVVLGDQVARHGLGLAALRAAGHDPAGFFTDDGKYDADAVDAAARETAEKFGIRRPGGVPQWAGTGPERTPSTGWKDVIRDPH